MQMQTAREEKFNVLTHAIGVAMVLISFPFLIAKTMAMKPFLLVAVLLYGFGMLAVFLSSSIYHSIKEPNLKKKAKIVDHICIFFLIGGTYAPFIMRYVEMEQATFFWSPNGPSLPWGCCLNFFLPANMNGFPCSCI